MNRKQTRETSEVKKKQPVPEKRTTKLQIHCRLRATFEK